MSLEPQGERRVVVDLRFEEGSVTGQLVPSGSPVQPFLGWLGLLSALESLAPKGPADPPHV